MGKVLFIAEKPSVAREFAAALKEKAVSKDGYMESDSYVITWCVGHLVTMSYPDAYDEKYKKWSLDTLPFIPKEFKYEVIPGVKKQFEIVKRLLNRKDIETIYVCTDSGREGEYIYRLVEMMAQVKGKKRKRVWIDSQTEEEILRGIREAKDLGEYDNLSESAFLRAKEDYLMGINFSRALSLKYAYAAADFLGEKYRAIAVGRVMTCILGMVVKREREIRNFEKVVYYKINADLSTKEGSLKTEWKAVDGSNYFASPLLYKDNGFLKKEDAECFIEKLKETLPFQARVVSVSDKKETKNAPMLFNLAELQNECSRRFKISPDETLKIAQELYEKKLCTYPRTDARVLSSAVAKQIEKNLNGLKKASRFAGFVDEIFSLGSYSTIGRTKYTNDDQITDHYAIIPTGQGAAAVERLPKLSADIYELIVRRFLSIFYPPAVYKKTAIRADIGNEAFFANFKTLTEEGYLKISGFSSAVNDKEEKLIAPKLKKGDILPIEGFEIKEGETTPPKRYTSGSMILAMENAGQLIEDESLRAQIKGSGIGTSATRAEIIRKLISISYLNLNKKTQVINPTQFGEMVADVVEASIKPLLNPELTASWEKGLTYVANGEVSPEEYMDKLSAFITKYSEKVKEQNNVEQLRRRFEQTASYYTKRA